MGIGGDPFLWFEGADKEGAWMTEKTSITLTIHLASACLLYKQQQLQQSSSRHSYTLCIVLLTVHKTTTPLTTSTSTAQCNFSILFSFIHYSCDIFASLHVTNFKITINIFYFKILITDLFRNNSWFLYLA